jgi:hypothetical protein
MHIETATKRNRLSCGGAAEIAREKDCERGNFLGLNHPFYRAPVYSASSEVIHRQCETGRDFPNPIVLVVKPARAGLRT